MNLLEQIYQAGLKHKDRLAVSQSEQGFTYTQLFQAIHQITQQIKATHVSERPILVFGKNDFLTLATMLAVSNSGRAYIPVDAHTPLERTGMIFNAAKPSLVLTTVELQSDYRDVLKDPITVNYDASVAFDWADVDLKSSIRGNQSNYIIYTSGTTGTPKGVEVSHDNLLTFTNWMNQDFEKFEHNHFLEQALYSFDLSIFSIYPSLTTAGTLVSLSRDETMNFKLLFERLNRSEINTWISTPSFVDICLLDRSFVEENHPTLQQFIFCGEELTVKTAEKLLQAFPHAQIYNTYGPTEATGAISQTLVTQEMVKHYHRLPLGHAKPGVEIQILDGELIIIGDSVAKGYFENPEKTKQAFFEIDGKRAYHSGDAGSIDPDGLVHYQGRIDFQVKFNGFRIELQDIEANLQLIDQVEKAIVLPKVSDDHKVVALVAVIQTKVELPTRADERNYTKLLKSELLKSVMEYMLPTKFVYLDEFPLNANGKIDRKMLATQVLGN